MDWSSGQEELGPEQLWTRTRRALNTAEDPPGLHWLAAHPPPSLGPWPQTLTDRWPVPAGYSAVGPEEPRHSSSSSFCVWGKQTSLCSLHFPPGLSADESPGLGAPVTIHWLCRGLRGEARDQKGECSSSPTPGRGSTLPTTSCQPEYPLGWRTSQLPAGAAMGDLCIGYAGPRVGLVNTRCRAFGTLKLQIDPFHPSQHSILTATRWGQCWVYPIP